MYMYICIYIVYLCIIAISKNSMYITKPIYIHICMHHVCVDSIYIYMEHLVGPLLPQLWHHKKGFITEKHRLDGP